MGIPKPYYERDGVKLYHGDNHKIVREIEPIDSIVTDPPYGWSFMGKKWDYDVPSVDVWRDCLKILKPGGHALVACGTRTQHRMAVNLEDAGFEIRDLVAWVYGSGFPKSLNIGKAVDELQGNEREAVGESRAGSKERNGYKGDMAIMPFRTKTINLEITKGHSPWEGWGTALKPAMELWTLCRKPLSEKTVAENVLKHGTGGINVDGCRVGTEEGKQVPVGRFPANFIHDGSEEVVMGFPKTGQPCGSVKKTTHRDGMFHIGQPGAIYTQQDGENRSASRFFYSAKASKHERNEGLEKTDDEKNYHPTVKPVSLMRYLCRLITPKNGTVLDPFMGSGSTGIAAKMEGFNFIGIEIDEKYCEIASKRIQLKQEVFDFGS